MPCKTSLNGVPDMIRTCDLRFRKPLLYPAELRRRGNSYFTLLLRLAASGAVLALCVGPAIALDPAECTPLPRSPAQAVSAVLATELTLSSGQGLALSGIFVPLSQQDKAKAVLSQWLAGHAVSFNALSDTPDRYARMPADIFVQQPEQSYLQARLVHEGLALAFPFGPDSPCRALLAAAEKQARLENLGLWKDKTAIIESDDITRLTQSSGEFAIVEGVLRSVAVRDYAVFFNFSGPWKSSFSAMVLKTNRAAFDKAVQFADKAGQRMTMRGIIETAPRLRLSLQSPDSFGFVEAP